MTEPDAIRRIQRALDWLAERGPTLSDEQASNFQAHYLMLCERVEAETGLVPPSLTFDRNGRLSIANETIAAPFRRPGRPPN